MSSGTKNSDIKISDVGPIERLDIKLQPGVNVLRGRNETGKSTALKAVDAITHNRSKGLEARDGSTVGFIQGGGVTLKIGKRIKSSGSCEFMVVSDPSDISKLVDPGYVDQAARTRTRVRALLAMTGQEITLDQFAEQIGDVDVEGVEEGSDPVETAGRIRKHLQLLARQAEKSADELSGQHQTITSQVKEFGEIEEADEEELNQQLSARIAAVSELESRQREAERDIETRKSLRELADKYEERHLSVNESEKAMDHLHAKERDQSVDVKESEQEVDDLRERLAAAEQQLKNRKSEHKKTLEQIKSQNDYHEQLVKSCNDAAEARDSLNENPVPFPTEEEFSQAKQSVQETQDAIHRARQSREIKQKVQQAKEIENQRQAKDKKAKQLRDAADRIDDVLSSAVNVEGLSVKGGELVITRDGKTEPFERLSHGARWKTGIATAAKSIRRIEGDDCLPVVAIPQEAWESQGQGFRDSIQQAAVECGVAIVTAEIAESDLTAESVGQQD